MNLETECIPCMANMAVSALRRLSVPRKSCRDIFSEILKLPAFQGMAWDQTSPEVIEEIWGTICRLTAQADPFLQEKKLQNERVLALAPVFRRWIQQAEDPLKTAVHMATIGNSVDLMIDNYAEAIEAAVQDGLLRHLPEASYAQFSNALKHIKRLVYLGDNSGEVVFDKLLLESIREFINPDIYFVVRSVPTMNDVTRKEAEDVGIPEVAAVIENGIDGPVPGTLLSRCAAEVRNLMASADLIISKGGGNFDVFEGDVHQVMTDTTFLLLCKCHPYERYFDRDRGDPILWNRFFHSSDSNASP